MKFEVLHRVLLSPVSVFTQESHQKLVYLKRVLAAS